MAHDDRILLELWSKQGDGEAFRTLVSRYGGMVYGACRRILGNPSDAEDAAQECFEALATAGTKPGSYVGAWLHRVATYHALNRIRGEARRKQREMLFHTARPAECEMEWKDIYACVDEAIDELPEKFRRPLIAHYLEGQSKKEVGEALGVSWQLASYRIERGLESVRLSLQRKGISLGTALLASLMGANAAEAVPAVLAARLGKIALAGPGVTANVAAAAAVRAASSLAVGASAVKVAGGLAGIVLAVAAVLFFGWNEVMRPYPTQDITASSTFSESESSPVEKRLVPVPSGEGEGEGEAPVPSESGAVQRLEPGTLIYGTVLDEYGRPVPNATVTLDNQEATQEQQFLSESRGMPMAAQEVNLRQITSVQGEFTFERVRMEGGERGQLVLAASSGERYAVKTIEIPGDGRQSRHELVLSPSGIVRGTVVDEKDARVPGAWVMVYPVGIHGGDLNIRLITKPDGSFETRPLPQGTYELWIVASGFRESERPWVEADGTDHLIRIARKGPVGSISGWVVNAEDGCRMPGLGIKGAERPEVVTGPNGEFLIGDAAEGTWALALSKRSAPYALAEPVSVELRPGQHVTGVELKATHGLSVNGLVLDEDTRKPVAHAGLVFERAKGDLGAHTIADENGCFTIAQLGPGDYTVRMSRPTYRWLEKTAPLSVLRDLASVELLMAPLRAARGSVINGSGAPVAGASVVVIPSVNFAQVSGVTNASGVFDIPLDECVESFYVQVHGDRSLSRLAGPLGIDDRPVLRLEDAGTIEGTVANSAGKPVAGAIVAAVPEEEDRITARNSDGTEWSPDRAVSGINARTSLSGAFELDPVLPGRIHLQVYLPSSANGYPVAETAITVRAGQTLNTKLVIDLAGYSTIEGTITRGDAPIPFAPVEASSPSRDWMLGASARSDANGDYLLENIRAGEVKVTVRGEGRNNMSQVIEVAENEARTLDFDFGSNTGGVEGQVTINGKPEQGFLSVKNTEEDEGTVTSETTTDAQGYYRIANLPPGKYLVQLRKGGIRVPPVSVVEVAGTEFARCDFALETGRAEGAVQGLRPGEKAGVGVFPGTPDPRDLLALPMTSMDEMMVTYMVTSESGQFQFDDIPPGIYTVAAVALQATPDGSEPDPAASLA